MKKIIMSALIISTLLGNGVIVNAQSMQEADNLENQYCAFILKELESAGEIEVEDVVSAKVVECNNTKDTARLMTDDVVSTGLEAVQFHIEDEEEVLDVFAIPFYSEEDGLENVTRSSVQSKPFSDSQFVYVLVTVTYHYYSGAETNWAGPYYRPTLVKAEWSDSTGSKTVSSIYANFNNANHVINLSDNSIGSIVNTSSTVSQNNPGNGITYVGNVINMSSNNAYSMYFNGIDTYSYVYGYITDSASQQYSFSFAVFDGSGLNHGI